MTYFQGGMFEPVVVNHNGLPSASKESTEIMVNWDAATGHKCHDTGYGSEHTNGPLQKCYVRYSQGLGDPIIDVSPTETATKLDQTIAAPDKPLIEMRKVHRMQQRQMHKEHRKEEKAEHDRKRRIELIRAHRAQKRHSARCNARRKRHCASLSVSCHHT